MSHENSFSITEVRKKGLDSLDLKSELCVYIIPAINELWYYPSWTWQSWEIVLPPMAPGVTSMLTSKDMWGKQQAGSLSHMKSSCMMNLQNLDLLNEFQNVLDVIQPWCSTWHIKCKCGTVIILLWPSDAIWQHRTGTTLAQIMAWCLTALMPNHYLNQCWVLISGVLWHSPEIIFTASFQAIIPYNEFENYTVKITATSPRGWWSIAHIDGLAQDCRHSIANALELLQFWAKLLVDMEANINIFSRFCTSSSLFAGGTGPLGCPSWSYQYLGHISHTIYHTI